MTNRRRVLPGLVALVFLTGLASMTTPLAFAQASIPGGSTITEAQFSINAGWDPWWLPTDPPAKVFVHPISTMWLENAVTWDNFITANLPSTPYDETAVGSFDVEGGWNYVDVTDLVQGWVNGTIQNFGILLKQDANTYTPYLSSENSDRGLRPKLEIWYVDPSGTDGYILIQRPEDAQEDVSDAYISDTPTYQPGNSEFLYTGFYDGYEKISLIRFNFYVSPPPPPGTGTQGYWKNHPDAWPVDEIEVGCSLYTRDEAIKLMKTPARGDKTLSMFAALVSAKLNVIAGNDDSCIAHAIAWADKWMCEYPPGSRVRAGGRSSTWRKAERFYTMLRRYNTGQLPCAEHRDCLE